ncbi:MAG: AraC family transcriptional regulator [Butyrivibrio sp.]|nr:AraC family transcriptional regulator [Butyrivibrio sp.]
MNIDLLSKLSVITEEEQAILNGNKTINRELYYSADKKSSAQESDEIDSGRVLQDGKLIDIRPHVRFVHFPEHTHNFVEFIYMCQGQTTHIIDGQKVVLRQGDLLFMNQHAKQEIEPAGRHDIAVNFMIQPEFFDVAFQMMDKEENPLREFIISCLTKESSYSNYLHFHVVDILPIQNLMENMIWNMLENESNQQLLNQTTMGLLFQNLSNHTELINVSEKSYDQELVFSLLRYIEHEYRIASLTDFCSANNVDNYTISRLIKKNTSHTFKELLQNKRMSEATHLLKTTNIPIADISEMVGYDNTSFFHRLFRRIYGCSPRDYRLSLVSLENAKKS